jgi:N-acetylmuramoyl-L-alanine amidase
MVVDLDGPLALISSNVVVNKNSRRAVVTVQLKRSDAESFAQLSGAPNDPEWDLPTAAVLPVAPKVRPGDGLLRVVLDPGHGGIDPGAEREGIVEKDLMLTFARELKEELLRSGRFEVVLTREDDSFVSLERRVEIAHAVDAQVLISLHADTAAEGHATGAVVHLLSKTASDEASRKLAERHERDDMLAGVDLTGKDDVVAEVLLDLARLETEPRTQALARSLVEALKTSGAPMNRKPIRAAGFSVLKAADIPSLLLEVGFLSSSRDLKNLRNPDWRAQIAAGIREALQVWVIEDAAASKLVRQ